MLTVDQADRLRQLTRTTLAEIGYEVDMFGEHARTADGAQYGLWNLATRAALEHERTWGKLVRNHFTLLTEAMAQASPDLSDEQLERDLLTRLVETDSLGQHDSEFTYAPEWMPGISRVLVIDEPQTVRTLMDRQIRPLGPAGPLFDRGHRNLLRMLDSAEVSIESIDDGEGHHVEVAVSDNVYVASMAQCLDLALARWLRGVNVSNGVVFAIPCRNQLAFRVVTDSAAALDALMLLPRIAVAGFSDGTGPVSPHTYLWLGGEVTQLTDFTGDELVVRPGPLERWLTEE
jgi:hypothetical protein